MMARAGAILCAALITAGCTAGSGGTPAPSPTTPTSWAAACTSFEATLESSFAGLFTAPADDYRAYSAKVDRLARAVRAPDATPLRRVAAAARALGDLTVPSDPDPNTAEQLAARDELAEAIVTVSSRCRAAGHVEPKRPAAREADVVGRWENKNFGHSIELDAKHRYTAEDGCNFLAGRWSLDPASGIVRLHGGSSTLVACPGRQVAAFDHMRLSGGRLQYSAGDQTTILSRQQD